MGDRFYLCENKILCEYDYEERLVFASMANHPILKRQAHSIGQASPNNAGGLLGGAGAGGGMNANNAGGPNNGRTGMGPGDLNNNGPQNGNGQQSGVGVGVGGFGGPQGVSAAHMKSTLGASS